MEKLLSQGVKDVIASYPEVGDILEEYGIGCTDCTLGSCQLKDVVTIHHMPDDAQAELMLRIEVSVYPERRGKISLPEVSTKPVVRKITYSPPVAKLVAEHSLIKRWLKVIPLVIKHFTIDIEQAWEWVSQGVDFSRNFADKYHHAKEEDILFVHTDQTSEIIQVMLADHVTGRNHIKGILTAIEDRDQAKAAKHLLAYKELLQQHIKKEDEALFPWIDRSLTTSAVGKLYSQFTEVDSRVAPDFADKYEQFIAGIEEKLLAK